jgi:hypothetical protein
MSTSFKIQISGSFLIIGFITFIAFLVIGFFGGDQKLIESYPEHKGLISVVADIIRLLFWIPLIIIIMFIILMILAAIFL